MTPARRRCQSTRGWPRGWLPVAASVALLAVQGVAAAALPAAAPATSPATTATATAAAATTATASGCTLQLLEHRSGVELLRVPLPARQAPRLQLGFTHSVLGTPVLDAYTWRAGAWHLTEEQFEGEGYGLPYAAAAGETLERHGTGWRLLLDRTVAPLVVRPLPAQQMRLLLPDGRQWLLGTLSTQAIELTTSPC